MKNLKFIAAIGVAVICMGSCSRPKILEGTAVEVSTNTLTVTDRKGNIVTFVTAGAEKECPAGIKPGSPVTISYRDEIKDSFGTAWKVTAPANYNYLVGSWIQIYPVVPGGITQGFRLLENGAAESINMATLIYDGWRVQGNELTLTGHSIGNGQTIDFSDVWTIERVDGHALTIRLGDDSMCYEREQL